LFLAILVVLDFWVSRSTYLDSDKKAHILDIIPPDEYVDHVNDSVYSNFVAIKSLQYVVDISSFLNISCSKCSTYQQLANDIVILYDEVNGIHPEYRIILEML
jgi:trehalose/maltose hydrolase-like predicted phosphorylase